MLVLSRRREESIRISDNIVVTVIDIRGNRVRIGIDVPKEIPVLRTELQNHVFDPTRHDFRSVANRKASNNFQGIQAWETEGGAEEWPHTSSLLKATSNASMEYPQTCRVTAELSLKGR